MAKKENNSKNYQGRQAWMDRKKSGRPVQTWWVLSPEPEPAPKKHAVGAVPAHN